MTAWPPAELPGLHVDMQARPPTADYRCRCGWETAASGDQVPHIGQAIDEHHQHDCPARGAQQKGPAETGPKGRTR